MKRFRSVCRAAGAMVLLLCAGRCAFPRAPVANLPACSVPRVDTTGWVRRGGPYSGFSYRLPAAFKEDTAARFMHGGTRWRDGPREFHESNGQWDTTSFRGGYTSKPTHPGHSECWDSIAGLRVFIVTGYRHGQYQASGWFRRPGASGGLFGDEVVLGGQGATSEDQALFLAIFRTVAADSVR